MVQYNAVLLLLVQLKVHRVTVFTDSSVHNPLLNEDGHVNSFSFTKKSKAFHLHNYSHILVTALKEFIKQYQQIKSSSDNFFIAPKIFELSFSPNWIKEWNTPDFFYKNNINQT